MINRPRRLRFNPEIRKMVRETRLSSDSLILPLFIK
ncbi:MAG: porphobilinogen synthase, partial [Oscillospiraceae bacterium]